MFVMLEVRNDFCRAHYSYFTESWYIFYFKKLQNSVILQKQFAYFFVFLPFIQTHEKADGDVSSSNEKTLLKLLFYFKPFKF